MTKYEQFIYAFFQEDIQFLQLSVGLQTNQGVIFRFTWLCESVFFCSLI